MAEQSKSKREAFYYIPGRSQAVTWSTKATSEFLALVHRQHPGATISQLREILTSEDNTTLHSAAVAVLNAYIRAGQSDYIPDWL